MKSDKNGCSTCANGQESFEHFRFNTRNLIQYDYRTPDGKLFSCVRATLNQCREARDKWLAGILPSYSPCDPKQVDPYDRMS